MEGTTREARQVDLDQIVNERMSAGLKAFLARIERVAELPPSSELLARTPGSDQAYVLVSGEQGIPVNISSEDTQGIVQLSEVLTPDAPLSNLDAEVAGQLRQWNSDGVHRVPRETLMRWYLGRDALTEIKGRDRFCLLSALHERGYPMYWASQMNRPELENFVNECTKAGAYPESQLLPYIIGAFFFSRRHELIAQLKPYFKSSLANVVERLGAAQDIRSYLMTCRIPLSKRIRVNGASYELEQLMDERETVGRRLFDELMQYHTSGNVPESMRSAAHQLDVLVHGDLDS